MGGEAASAAAKPSDALSLMTCNQVAAHLLLHWPSFLVVPKRDFMEERRKVHRGRTYLAGRIAFNYRSSSLDCLVRSLSQDGATIVFSEAVGVPAEFDVMIPRKGESRRARVVWRDATQAGVLFLPAAADNVVSIEAALRAHKLEAEREGLQRRIAELTEPT
jgi:hypothetical protein